MAANEIESLRKNILDWHDLNARDLPWRGEKDPYRIFVSEIMLQQTRAETVIPYYRAFLEAFPDADALGDADESAVLKKWEGLGYYSRARNLQKAARVVSRELGGQFPMDVKGLKELPGIGEYTAGAIASIAFNLPESAIDGNQVRVLSRLFLIDTLTTRPETKNRLREMALLLIDRERPGDFNQALMGLGALVCVPRAPLCASCPAAEYCAARRAGVERQLPVLPARTEKKTERRAVALVFSEDRVLVRRRADRGLLAGLYEFPNFLDAHRDAEVREALLELGVRAHGHRAGEQVTHVFTHLIWEMKAHLYRSDGAQVPGHFYVNKEELAKLPMPSAMAKYREAALKEISC